MFNYSKFYVITYFTQYIRDYSSTVKYDKAYSKAAYKYIFKVFYNRTNKKEYDA